MRKKNKTVWSKRFKNPTLKSFQRIGSSINVDKRLYREDIFASKVHTLMLIKQKIIPKWSQFGVFRKLFFRQHAKTEKCVWTAQARTDCM